MCFSFFLKITQRFYTNLIHTSNAATGDEQQGNVNEKNLSCSVSKPKQKRSTNKTKRKKKNPKDKSLLSNICHSD